MASLPILICEESTTFPERSNVLAYNDNDRAAPWKSAQPGSRVKSPLVSRSEYAC